VAGFAAYHNGLAAPFMFDDFKCVHNKEIVHSVFPISDFFASSRRPLLFLSLALNYSLSELQVWSYHLTNLAIHIAAAIVLMRIVTETARRIHRVSVRESADWLGFSVALIWLVHPLQTESVTYIVQRSESAMSLCYLLMLYCILRSEDSHWRHLWVVAAAIAFYAGLGFKEVIVSAPLVAVLFDRAYLSKSFREVLRKRWALAVAMAPAVLWLGWRVVETAEPVAGRRVGFAHQAVTPWEYLSSQSSVLLHYLKLTICPTGLCLDYAWPVTESTVGIVVPGLIIVALLLISLWLSVKHQPLGWPALSFFLILAPTSSFFPISDLAFEHRMYLPLACLITLLVVAFIELTARISDESKRDRVRLAVPIAISTVLIALTIDRNGDYGNRLVMWQDVVAKAPHNARAHYNLGLQLDKYNHPIRAIEEFKRSLERRPRDPRASFNLAGLYHRQGDFEQAKDYYKLTLKFKPEHPNANANLAHLYAELGDYRNAEKFYTRSVALRPNDPKVNDNYGNYFARRGQLDEAAELYDRSIECDANYWAAHWHRGIIYYQQNEYAAAIDSLKTARRLQPDLLPAARLLAHLLATAKDQQLRDGEKALQLAQKVASRPGYNGVRSLTVLAEAYAELGDFPTAVRTARDAQKKAADAGESEAAELLETQLLFYEKHQPYRLSSPVLEIL
jgi:tetratricopeptide (TPR) repeat protein